MAPVKNVDVLVIGGGVSGTAAAWQAARMGASVLVVESSPWVGGMITAAGVSAFDGNKGTLGSGFYRRLRDFLDSHYGGKKAVFTGWISETCFEPRVAAEFLASELRDAGVETWHGAEPVRVLREQDRINGAVVRHRGGEHEVRARITIEATEYGDVLAMAGMKFRLGRDSRAEFGEPHAPEAADMRVQDMTVCAILKKHTGRAPAVPRPPKYDPKEFDGCLAMWASNPDEKYWNHKLHSWESFISYASLPNDKYLLNWPFTANDSPDTIGVFGTPAEREEALRLARAKTIRFVHFMQNELGHPEWGIAEDEFDTPDKLAFIPYVREARRCHGKTTMIEGDVLPMAGCARPPFRADSIAVGDYYLDHHHSEEHLPPGVRFEENYPPNAPFQVSFGCLVPTDVRGLIVAEKSISVSHIVNGCSRLQPVVMLIGQAAGAAAGLCVKRNMEPGELEAKDVQDFLIGEGVMLYVYRDLDTTHPSFRAVQQLAMAGAFRADDPYEFRPDEPATADDAARWAGAAGITQDAARACWREWMTRGKLAEELTAL